ncbi:MAG: SLBB domain-containing protein, partial [Hyphomicrobiales bacterium]|nr:SLBB domain-containing protein [Hyphomicrobiales bacterium]
ILLNPVVTVDVVSSRPIYVMGEVEKPGEYTYRNGLNVLSAVAVAGGFTYRASKSKVLVKRAGEKGLTEFRLSPDIPVYPGDLVSVPERYF